MLADGVQAAFAAGVVAELARQGASWEVGAGVGLGAELALLALLGRAAEGEGRWREEGTAGCPLFVSQAAAAAARLGNDAEVAVWPDPWRLAGWLDPGALAARQARVVEPLLDEFVAAGRTLRVAVVDLEAGAHRAVNLAEVSAGEGAVVVRAAAAFPGGWGPLPALLGGTPTLLAGGVDALPALLPLDAESGAAWEVVCGFPVPAVARPGLARSLFEQVQRRSEIRAAMHLKRMGMGGATVRVFAPTDLLWREWAGRDGAELGVEYPLPWERNGELVVRLVDFGRFVAGAG